MAAINKRINGDGSIKWQARIRRLGVPTTVKSFRTKGAAEKWAREIESMLDAGHRLPSKIVDRKTLAEAIDEFERRGPRIKTQADRSTRVAWWRAQRGSIALKAFDSTVVSSMRDQLEQENIGTENAPRHRAAQTVRHYLLALSAALDWTRRELKWIAANLITDVKVPPIASGRIRWLEPSQQTALLDACTASDNPDLYLIVLMAVTPGARYGELANLKWPQIDFGESTARLPTSKSGEPRVIPLTSDVVKLLQRRVRRLGTDLVFASDVNPKKPRNHAQAFAVACRRAGLVGWRFHDLRHSAATAMLKAGVDSRIVARVLGHRTMAMMLRYTHVDAQQVVEAVRRATY